MHSIARALTDYLADRRTEDLLAEAEGRLWQLQEIAADLENDAAAWTGGEANVVFLEAQLERLQAEIARRARLRDRPGAPPWPGRWRDRRPDAAEIKAKLDLVTYIETMTPARFARSGRQFVTHCPFADHDDGTPSFSVDATRRLFHCFGCGRGGDVFTFVQAYLNLDDFAAAVDVLAATADAPVTREVA